MLKSDETLNDLRGSVSCESDSVEFRGACELDSAKADSFGDDAAAELLSFTDDVIVGGAGIFSVAFEVVCSERIEEAEPRTDGSVGVISRERANSSLKTSVRCVAPEATDRGCDA